METWNTKSRLIYKRWILEDTASKTRPVQVSPLLQLGAEQQAAHADSPAVALRSVITHQSLTKPSTGQSTGLQHSKWQSQASSGQVWKIYWTALAKQAAFLS